MSSSLENKIDDILKIWCSAATDVLKDCAATLINDANDEKTSQNLQLLLEKSSPIYLEGFANSGRVSGCAIFEAYTGEYYFISQKCGWNKCDKVSTDIQICDSLVEALANFCNLYYNGDAMAMLVNTEVNKVVDSSHLPRFQIIVEQYISFCKD